jgi:hypothetical protein
MSSINAPPPPQRRGPGGTASKGGGVDPVTRKTLQPNGKNFKPY